MLLLVCIDVVFLLCVLSVLFVLSIFGDGELFDVVWCVVW